MPWSRAGSCTPSVSAVFAKNHPGGAIGAAFKKSAGVATLSVPWAAIPVLASTSSDTRVTGAEVLRAGYASPSGWVRVNGGVVSPSRIRRLSSGDLACCIEKLPWLVTHSCDFISVCSNASTQQAVDVIKGIREDPEEEQVCREDSVIAVVERGDCVGVLEVAQLR